MREADVAGLAISTSVDDCIGRVGSRFTPMVPAFPAPP